ncbi:MAG: NRPS [Watsoniomyces obsoletus]|nr:MAG: NRPS [Watsoniomyces obsoletus]
MSYRYTLFPDLRSHEDLSARRQQSQQVWIKDLAGVELQEVVLAWAEILVAYTGNDDDPVFDVDESAVKVELATGNIISVETDPITSSGGCKTAVYITHANQDEGKEQERPSSSSATQQKRRDAPLYVQLTDEGLSINSESAGIPAEQVTYLKEELAARILLRRRDPPQSFRWNPHSGLKPSMLNEGPRALEGPQFFHQLFGGQASRDTLALEYLDEGGKRTAYSYAELDRLSDGLASKIEQILTVDGAPNDPPHRVIPILIPQSPALYVAILAVLRTGAAFCPLDLDAPPERLRFILTDLSAKLVLADQTTAAKLTWNDGPQVVMVPEHPDVSGPADPSHMHRNLIDPKDPAYIMYTSGSTGTPKGVAVSHRAVTQSLLAHEELIPEFDRFLQFAAPTFDVFVFEMFFPFFRGSTLITCNRRDLLNRLPSVINDLNVDAAVLTPTVVGGLLQKRRNVPGLRLLMTIGEMLTRPIIDEFGDGPQQEGILYAMYGPTEASIHCTTAPKLHRNSKVGIIGAPFETVSAYIAAPRTNPADGQLDILPQGHVGELVLGGHQLASGYWNRPERTRASFTMSEEYGRIYRTGDKARLLPNGILECLGRLTASQVKLRGHRLELGEIERVALNIPAVSSAVASVSDGLLILFCVTEDEGMTAASITEALRRWLPEPLLPAEIMLIPGIPRLPSGKADKRALEAKYRSTNILLDHPNGKAAYDLNAGTRHTNNKREEQSIRQLLARLSDVNEERIQGRTTIFQLGLDSICAVRIAASLREQGWNVFAADVLQNPSVDALASILRKNDGQKNPKALAFDFEAFDRVHRSSIVSKLNVSQSGLRAVRPCTAVQSGMLAKFLNSEGKLYLAHIVLELDPEIQLDCLENAWNMVIEKYAMLRTGFSNVNDRQYPFAMLEYEHAKSGSSWPVLSSGLSIEQATKEAKEKAREAILPCLQERPWRISILEIDNNRFLHLSILHALFDAQSLRRILSDMATSYNGHQLQAEGSIEAVLGSILEPSLEQEDKTKTFWESAGQNMSPTEFPNLCTSRSKSGKCLVRSLESSWSRKQLEESCRQEGVTLSAVGQAAWARILSAYLGQDVVTFGAVFTARTSLEHAQESVFPCVATLPIGCRTQSSNRELVQTIMEVNSQAVEHQFTPLRKIHKWLGYGQRPLFDTIFAFQKYELEEAEGQEPWHMIDEDVEVDYAVSFEMETLKDDRIVLRLSFHEDSLPEEQAVLLLKQLDHLLIDILSKPDGLCPDFSSISSNLLSITPPKQAMLQSDVSLLHEFVEHYARKTPLRTALEFVESLDGEGVFKSQWTFEELNHAGDNVVALVVKAGLQLGDLVAISFDKCPEAYFAILGVLKSGCGYVAIDPDAPVARRSYIISDSNAKLILTTTKHKSDLSDITDIPVVAIDEERLLSPASTNFSYSPRQADPGSICYCLYTSGTTGNPKGCEISHRNVVQSLLAFQRVFAGRWNDTSRWLQFASFHFDVSVLEQYWSWSVGIRVVSAPKDLMLSDLSSMIRELQITHIDLTPSLARTLTPEDAPSLCEGVFITGGELLTQDVLDAWGRTGCIHNAYGPTEATIGVSVYPRVPAHAKPSNIGAQFDNVGTYVLAPESSSPVIRGAVGELCLSGVLVGKGYRNRPELTAQRFQYLENLQERVYRTGDMVRILHNGTFEFLGRADDQVKLRGQRLETAEVNEVIKKNVTEVTDVATLVLRHPRLQKDQLVCFVVLKSSTTLDSSTIIQTTEESSSTIQLVQDVCRARLPSYGVPTQIIPVSRIPLSTNHKVDVNVLKNLYAKTSIGDLQSLSKATQSVRKNWSLKERKIVETLADFVRMDMGQIRSDSNIFELGVDSISVIGLAKALKEKGFTRASVHVILQSATIHDLIETLVAKKTSSPASMNSIMAARQKILVFAQNNFYPVCRTLDFTSHDYVETVLPCTPLQEAILFASLNSSEFLYFNAFLFNLHPDVQLPQLQQAWQNVAEKTEILRSSICATKDGFAQLIRKRLGWCVHRYNASDKHPTTVTRTHLNKYSFEEWQQQNSIRLPFVVHLIRTPSKLAMVIQIFHALYDGISFQLMLRHLSEEYRNVKNINYGPRFRDVLPYGPLCVPEGAKDFWTQHLRNAAPVHMPLLTGIPSSGEHEVALEMENFKRLEQTRRLLGATYQALFQACWMAVLRKYLGKSVTVGMVVSGRSINVEEVELTIGPLFNTIPFCLHFEEQETWKSLVQRCHEFNKASLPYQHTPLRDITKWCKQPARESLFDTLFVFDKDLEVPEEPELWTLQESASQAEYPLAVEARLQRTGTIKLTLVAQNMISDEAISTSLLEEFQSNLEKLVGNPEALLEVSTTKPERTHDMNVTSNVDKEFPATHPPGNGLEFKWTPEARQIQHELSLLAAVSEDSIEATTSIFDLGLDSIDAIKLSSRLKQQGVKLDVSTIMQGRTIAGMVESLSNQVGLRETGAHLPDLEELQRDLRSHLSDNGVHLEDIEEVLPATGLQEAMIAEMISSKGARYFSTQVLKLKSTADAAQLMAAWETVIHITPILRTSFAEIHDPAIPGTYAQLVHRPKAILWEKLDCSDDQSFEDVIASTTAGFHESISRESLIKLAMIHHHNERYIVFGIAHALYDGWSLHLLHEDVRKAYFREYSPRPSYKPALKVMLESSGNAVAGFWKSQLSGAPAIHFPTSESGSSRATNEKYYRELNSKHSLGSVQAFCKAQGITLQAVGNTCWSVVLAHYTRTLEVVFGAVLAGRDFDAADRILFPTMNTVAIRSIIHGTRKEMLRYMTELNAHIAPYQHCPLRIAQSSAKVDGRGLFNTIFIVQKRPDIVSDEMEPLYTLCGGEAETEYPVNVEMEAVKDGFVWRGTADNSALDEDGLDKLLNQLDYVMGSLITSPDLPTVQFVESRGVVLCDLPPIEIKYNQDLIGKKTPDAIEGALESTHEWTEEAKSIRSVLSQVSKILEADIRNDQTIYHLGLDSISAIKVSALLRKRGIQLNVSDLLRATSISDMAMIAKDSTPVSSINVEGILRSETDSLSLESVCSAVDMKMDAVDRIIPATPGQVYFLSVWQATRGAVFHSTFTHGISSKVDKSRLETAWKMLIKQSPILRTTFVATRSRKMPFVQLIAKEESFINQITWIGSGDESALKEPSDDILTPAVQLLATQGSHETLIQLRLLHAYYDAVSLPLLVSHLESFTQHLPL